MKSKVFRLFVSSTFDDFRKEREVLQTHVFPRIKKYCADLGYVFYPIDLRWGISHEAQLNQKTLELCLKEVRACKTYPYPNFLLMLGDRYGWVPLPYSIVKTEFETLLEVVNQRERNELITWYKEDQNQLPISYVLKERSAEFAAHEKWNELEQNLRLILQKAATASGLSNEQRRKYFTSATEAEAIEGIISYAESTEYQEKLLEQSPELLTVDAQNTFAFFRNVERSSKCSNRFIAEDFESAQQFKHDVQAELLPENILVCSSIQVSAWTKIN